MNNSKSTQALIFASILTLTAVGMPQAALADGDSAAATSDAKAVLIAPLTLTALTALNFGTLIKNFSSGTESVTLEPNFLGEGNGGQGIITSSDNTKLIPFGGENDGDLKLTGESGYTIQVSAPASIELSKDGVAVPTAQQKLELDTFLFRVNRFSTPETIANGGSFVLEPGGLTDVDTGGTLTVEGDDETGAYSGSFTVTATYQ